MESQGKQTAVEIALNNPMILTEILQRRSTPLKDCRLVCHFWNDMVLNLPNTRLALRPVKKDKNRHILNDPFPFFATCFALDDRLAKQISATCSTDLADPTRCIDSFATTLMHTCDKFSDLVQILEISVDYEECLKTVYQVLRNCCPNLKQLRIGFTFSPYRRKRSRGCEILPEPLPEPKSNLTLLAVSSNRVTPFLTNLIKVIVAASPNLRNVTLPWGFFPDFANSKRLDTLLIVLDGPQIIDIAREDGNLSELSRILAQVGDQLVRLTFCDYLRKEDVLLIDFGNLNPTGFRLPTRKMLKLKKFRNQMADIFQCDDLLRNIESLPVLETLVIGKVSIKSNCVDEILRNIFHSGKIFQTMKNLKIFEMHEPTLLDGLKTAFPNLESLEVKTFSRTDFRGDVSRMELSVVLDAFGRWEGLKRLLLRVTVFPDKLVNVIRALLEGKELYKELKMFETGILKFENNVTRHELTTEEMDLFKQLLLAMNRMNKVIIHNLPLGEESLKTISDFMVSNKLAVPKFRISKGGSTRFGIGI
ncbi:uncharacterized protein LOC118435869 [Folsomia candida]|uniref:F-box domain-containing protein n=1 Tax=Folsomia candida TaxID=158441 RepID=A0A226E8Y6_FOLCA|nr:uncharacterized protein LOC118435869 [Folsomia candida]OXA53524.1 hypothetical protein Fcan01_10704 [Folsomia candida]